MTAPVFETRTGSGVPAVTADQMRAIDEIATQELGLSLLQMMENAGRTLALAVHRVGGESVQILAGSGGNGGGGLACARHLANHGHRVSVVLDRDPDALDGAAAHQHDILASMDVQVETGPEAIRADAGVVVDALVGYGLSGPLSGQTREMVNALPADADSIVSLDVPSGVDATTGDRPGDSVTPDVTVTLALPKTGLDPAQYRLFVADIGIPETVYQQAGIEYQTPFDGSYLVRLQQKGNQGGGG